MKIINLSKISGLLLLCTAISIASCKKDSGEDQRPDPPPNDKQQDIAGIDNAVNAFMTKYNVPAVSIAVAKNEKLVYAKAYGKADKEAGTDATTSHLFRIASVSKPITGVAITKLIQDKKLSMDDTVFGPGGILGTKYGTKAYSDNLKKITVKHLLHHTAGAWGNSVNDPMFMNNALTFTELINYTLDNRPVTKTPGTVHDYSNFGYCLLGRIIETVSGKSYEEYVKTEIFTPMGVKNIIMGGSKLADRKTNEAKYYGSQSGGTDPYAYNIERMDAHGGWIATPSDIVKFLCGVDGGSVRKDILTAESIKLMTTVPSLSVNSLYASGWGITGQLRWHVGSLPGNVCEIARNGETGINAYIVVNTRLGGQFTTDLDLLLWNNIVRSTAPWQNIDQF